MNVLPVITRELRSEARNSTNYGMRMVGVAALILMIGIFLWPGRFPFFMRGNQLFAMISLLTFFGIWILTPLLASDCLSGERRHGTLGLLFLTPLRPLEIVLGKSFIHFLRGLTLIAATTPILAIPFLLGGVTASDLLRVLCLYGTALFLSLAAGVLASSYCQNWMYSVVLTILVLALFAYFFVYLPVAIPKRGLDATGRFLRDWDNVVGWLFLLDGGRGTPWIRSWTALQTSFVLCLLSALVFLHVILFAAWRLRSTWQDKPPTVHQKRWKQIFLSTRFFSQWLRWKNRRQLTRNPVGWLQEYSWHARLSKWGWCLFIVVLDCWFAVGSDFNDLGGWLVFSMILLFLSVAFNSVSSFQREKESGALELLLVTPLREKQIIFGRLGGIWRQFLPSGIVLVLSLHMISPRVSESDMVAFIEIGRAFLLMPILGLYFALRLKNVVAAWLVTMVMYAVLPGVLVWWCDWTCKKIFGRRYLYTWFDSSQWGEWMMFAVLSTAFCFIAGKLLYRWLKERSFALGKG